jgi:hypothetical protein
VQIKLARGVYLLSTPTPTALSITFAGPSLTFEAQSGTPILSGTKTVRPLSVGATSNVTIDGLEIEFGTTVGLGGGIENLGTLNVKNSTFSSNSAGNGGAISNAAGATLAVENSTFSHNATTGVGGGAILSSGSATVERSAITNNTAPINGGGINVQPGGTMTISSSTIMGNTSGSLGGGLSNLGTLNVQLSTITDNTGSSGAAIATSDPTKVTLAADIITASASVGACNPPYDPANPKIIDAGYNLDDDGTCISPDSPATGSHGGSTAYGSSTYGAVLDAYLGGLANNGGPTKTVALLNSPNPLTTLANPALDVVPASFNLPVAVGGVSAACSLSDQRGVMPAVGSNCDIGAYLLQATKTALLASAAKVEQNASVTYTATVTPAPDGGTVAFDDGAGNPATSQCAARSLSSGTATCTVSYANKGAYSVTATYSGDGTMNNYAASASVAPTTTTVAEQTRPSVADRIPPSAPTKLKGRIKHGKLKLSWAASEDNVGVTQYTILRSGKVIKSTKAGVRSVSVRLTGRGGVYAVRAVDAAGNVSPLSKNVTVRRVAGEKKAYRIVK